MMQNTGGCTPNDHIFKGISELINARYAMVEITDKVGLDKQPQRNIEGSSDF